VRAIRDSVPSILVAMSLLAAPVAAHAEGNWSGEVPAKARSLAERGRMLHDAGDYGNAIIAFTQAYAMAPSPALLFNLAQAYRLQGDCDDAALMYRRYIATNPSPEARSLAETHLANVERCIHKLNLHIPVETAGTKSAPAQPVVTASVDGPSRKAQIEKDVGIGLIAGGGVALAIAGYYTVQAHNAAGEVAAAYEKGASWKDVAPIDARGKSAATSAKLFGAGAGVGIVGGVAMYLLGRHTESIPVTVAPASRGATVSMSWAF
jgi:tetratricopeptide (TPR) repeat protein